MVGSRWVLVCGVAGALSQGCSHAADRPPNVAPIVVSPEAARRVTGAVHTLAHARCEREQRCGQIGPDAKYSSTNVCLSRMRTDVQEQLNPNLCPRGVRDRALEACLEELREERCGDPFDTLSRRFTCARDEMCHDG